MRDYYRRQILKHEAGKSTPSPIYDAPVQWLADVTDTRRVADRWQ
jgi:hypothetical protein